MNKKNKKIIKFAFLFSIPVIIILVFPPIILAKTLALNSLATTSAYQTTKTASSTAEIQANRMASLKQRADLEIDRRIVSLNKLIIKISDLNKLQADSKTILTTQIQTEITNLTNLKVKIDADTDFTTLKTDTKSILASYRIYALFMPKIEILTAAQLIDNTAEKSASLSAKLQNAVDALSTSGTDTTVMQATLTNINVKIADALKQAAGAQNAVLVLTPAGYPGNKTTLQNARTMIQTGRQDLVSAYQLFITLIKNIRGEKTSTPDATSSGTKRITAPNPLEKSL